MGAYFVLLILGDRRYEVEVVLECERDHFYGEEEECRIAERFVQYKVDGIRGRGINEWQYRHPQRL